MYQGGVSLRRIDCSRGGYSPGGDHEPDCFNDTKCPRLFYDSQEGLLYKIYKHHISYIHIMMTGCAA